MVVKFELSALKRTKWYEIFLRILFGGVATVATGMIAKSFGPILGGLFLAFPAIFPATASLVEKHEREKKQRAGLNGTMRSRNAVALEARGAAMGSIGLAVFAIVVWKFLSGEPPWVVLAAAGLAWLVTSMLIWQLRRVIRSNRSKLKHAGQAREA
jgi:hypothetical protein